MRIKAGEGVRSFRTKYLMRVFAVCVGLALMLAPCGAMAASASSAIEGAAEQRVKLEITAPSEIGLVIAPGRHFKVSGTLEGDVPGDATMKVALLDADGREVRFAATNGKGTDRVDTSWYDGEITLLARDTDFAEIAYTAPEMAVADVDAPEASAHDATVKCVFTDDSFFALITSATDPAHGLVGEDGYALVDHDGNPYDALPEGAYTVVASLMDKDGSVLASASRDIEIGRKSGTVIHEITNPTVKAKGGDALLNQWAEAENATLLSDLLPGMFGPYYQMTTLPMSIGAETAEYLPGPILVLLYGNTTKSISYRVEISQFLQLQHNVENPEIASYYAFDLGEPRFSDRTAKIIALAQDENMRICRVDLVNDEARDGVFLTTEAQVLGYDADASDGFTVSSDKAFAVAGVMKPYQLQDDELVKDDSTFGHYSYLNGAQTLAYTFVSMDGGDAFTVEKRAGVSRIDEPTEESLPAVYEFYNVFPAGTLKAGERYDVSVQAFDQKGQRIENMDTHFLISG